MKQKEINSIYAEIEARIIPKSSKNEIVSGEDSVVKIRVTSPPVDGKANKAVVDLLSKLCKVPKRDIRIVTGEKARNKKIRVYGITASDFFKIIR